MKMVYVWSICIMAMLAGPAGSQIIISGPAGEDDNRLDKLLRHKVELKINLFLSHAQKNWVRCGQEARPAEETFESLVKVYTYMNAIKSVRDMTDVPACPVVDILGCLSDPKMVFKSDELEFVQRNGIPGVRDGRLSQELLNYFEVIFIGAPAP